jgi:nuclear GTP-binding protein
MSGKLLKGGEEDVNAVAKSILHDWQRGRIPWFTPPPSLPDGPSQTTVNVLETASAAEKDAAQGFASAAAEVTMKQVHRRMPQAHGLFDEEDRHDQEYATEDEDEPESEDDEGDEDEDEGKAKKPKRKRDEISDEEEPRDEAGEVSESEDVDLNDERVGDGVDAETLKKFASDDEDEDEDARGDDSDSDSDGYGPGGLSFDQVLAEMKGEVREKPSGVSGKSTTKKSRENKRKNADAFGASSSGKEGRTVSFVPSKKKSAARKSVRK